MGGNEGEENKITQNSNWTKVFKTGPLNMKYSLEVCHRGDETTEWFISFLKFGKETGRRKSHGYRSLILW